MKINFECVVFYQNNFFTEIELPDDIKFFEYCRHNDKQRFYTAIYKNDDELSNYIATQMCGRCRKYKFGDYMILDIRQCHPVNEDLPLISLDDLNKLFDEHIKGYYIKSERPSRNKSIEKNKDNKIEILKDGKPIDLSLDWLYDTYMTINPAYYTEYIAKPLGFVTRTGGELSMKFAVIQIYSWLGDDFHNHVHKFEIDIKELRIFNTEDYSHGQKITISNSDEIKNEYLSEIDKLMKMDNYEYIDYRKNEQKSNDNVLSTTQSYITPNQKFFQWIYDRLIHVHNENPNIDYMLSLKERIKDMQKLAWSKEDDEMLEDVRSNFEYNKREMTHALIEQYNHFFDKIKHLQPQPKQEWSEEDERMVETIIGHLERLKNYHTYTTNIEQCQEWLKSLKGKVQLKQE